MYNIHFEELKFIDNYEIIPFLNQNMISNYSYYEVLSNYLDKLKDKAKDFEFLMRYNDEFKIPSNFFAYKSSVDIIIESTINKCKLFLIPLKDDYYFCQIYFDQTSNLKNYSFYIKELKKISKALSLVKVDQLDSLLSLIELICTNSSINLLKEYYKNYDYKNIIKVDDCYLYSDDFIKVKVDVYELNEISEFYISSEIDKKLMNFNLFDIDFLKSKVNLI